LPSACETDKDMKLQDLQTPETLGRFSKQIDLNSSGSTMNEKDPRKVNGAVLLELHSRGSGPEPA